MTHYELLLEHRYRNRLLGSKRLLGVADQTMTIGSSPTADLRLLGEEVGGIHALIQFEQDRWIMCDTGAGSGTWVAKEAIFEKTLEDGTVVRIGDHELRISTREVHESLFGEMSPTAAAGSEVYHQVLVMRGKFILESHILSKDEAFQYHDGSTQHNLSAPADFSWSKKTLGAVEIQQRLVHNAHTVRTLEFKFKTLFEPEFRWPVAALSAVMLFMTIAALLMPHAPEGKMEPLDNPYSKIIYDGKLAKQLKKQSQALTKNMKDTRAAGNPGAGVAKLKEGPAKAPTAKVVVNLKTAGLSSLIGKISKRASKNAIAINSVGVTAGEKGATGPALGSIGGVTGKSGVKEAGGAMGSYKLGAVGTAGKGGGQNVGAASGGLGQGGVGSGDVGFVEEEGEVEGGLDKDVIAKYIKSQLGQIRYCYERQLSATPDLYGKVQIKFVISPTGAVTQQSIGSSTLKNAMVEGCILRRVASWKLPEPKGGTSVLVTYPFLFKSTN